MLCLKKIFVMTLAMLIIFSCTAFAAANNSVGVVIVGGAEFKTKDFYKMIPNVFDLNKSRCKVGDEIQGKYQKFLLERDLLGETIPRKQNLIDFAAKSGCSKVLFLVVDSTADHQNDPKRNQKNRLSIQVDAYLCDSLQVIDVQTTGQESNSNTSDLRARRKAFKKCLEELSKTMKNFS